MIDILFCDRDECEQRLLSEDCREQVARFSDTELRFDSISNDWALEDTIRRENLIDILYYSFQKGQSLDCLRRFRSIYGGTMMMLITESSVSPLEYLRPGVAPDSLLLRPVESERLRAANMEFLENYFERLRSRGTETNFIVDTRDEKVFIPYSHIYYFEARDKKLFARLKSEEYAFYDTMEELETKLPAPFQRCHRSYIVNTAKILRYIPKDSYFELPDQIGVPVSRRYKAEFRGTLA